jgi:CRP-like cAMP-binding protein
VLVDVDGGNLYADTDTAPEQLEEPILAIYADQTVTGKIRDYLAQLVDQPEQIETLPACLERKTFASGDYLPRQGDVDDGLYVIESGSMSAIIELPDQPAQRLKKFIPGALVGELSAYTDEKSRTASVIANSPAVVYHLAPRQVDRQGDPA